MGVGAARSTMIVLETEPISHPCVFTLTCRVCAAVECSDQAAKGLRSSRARLRPCAVPFRNVRRGRKYQSSAVIGHCQARSSAESVFPESRRSAGRLRSACWRPPACIGRRTGRPCCGVERSDASGGSARASGMAEDSGVAATNRWMCEVGSALRQVEEDSTCSRSE
jgi:hypothetical protein